MELPILYALTHPTRVPDAGTRRFDPVAAGTLTFEPVSADLYPAYGLGRAAAAAGGTAATAFNAANEVAVELFLAGKIPFGRIGETIARVLDGYRATGAGKPEAVDAADAAARPPAAGAPGPLAPPRPSGGPGGGSTRPRAAPSAPARRGAATA